MAVKVRSSEWAVVNSGKRLCGKAFIYFKTLKGLSHIIYNELRQVQPSHPPTRLHFLTFSGAAHPIHTLHMSKDNNNCQKQQKYAYKNRTVGKIRVHKLLNCRLEHFQLVNKRRNDNAQK